MKRQYSSRPAPSYIRFHVSPYVPPLFGLRFHPNPLIYWPGLAACKSVYTGSIPVLASKHFKDLAGTRGKLQKRFHIRFHISRFVFVLFRASCARAFCRAAPAHLTTEARLVWPVTAMINSSDSPKAASSDAVVWRNAWMS